MRRNIYLFNRLTAIILTAVLLGPMLPLEARTKKGDKFLAQGRMHEQKKDWDAALEAYEKALSEDPADILYQMAATKVHFQAAQSHIDKGLKLRSEGQLGEALLEFQKGYAINPGSAAAIQEIRRTTEMIERERKRVQETGKESDPRDRALTDGEKAKKETEDRIASILPVPRLRPIDSNPINLRMSGSSKLLFETVAKVAGLNVLWDPEYQPQVRTNIPVEFENSTLEEALDYLAVITKCYWKPLSQNTIFITMDNPNKRRDYEEQVAKVFYLSNVSTPQELQEIVNAVRSVADIQRFFPYNAQNAIIAKGSADQVALAEKILHDLDKPKSEVVVDIIVMEASSVYSRQLTAAIASAGLKLPVNWSPRGGITVPDPSSGSGDAAAAAAATSTSTTIPLANLGRISSADFSTTIPSALLQAILSDTNTKVLQSPQLRAVDNLKATMKIGDRQPTATGSFGSAIGSVGVGMSPLMNTQFTYIDVGVNVEMTPRVHDNGDVSMHVDLDISSVTGHVKLGDIDQPIIGQRKISHDIRMPEGAVQLLGGLTKYQETKGKTGIPGLANIPVLNRLFTGETVDRQRQELMIALIPHIVRRPEFTAENLRGIAVGNQTSVHLNYGRQPGSTPPVVVPKKDDPLPNLAVQPPKGDNSGLSNPPLANPAAPPLTPPAQGAPASAPGLAPPATAPPMTAPPASEPSRPEAPKPAGNAVVRFLPPRMETTVQGVMTVALIIENATDASSAPLQVTFDPKVVKLNDAGRGDFFSSDGQTPVFTKNIQNDAGAAAMNLNRLPNTPGVSGSGILTSLIFQGVAKGTTTISVPNLTVRNAQGQVVYSGSPQMTINVK